MICSLNGFYQLAGDLQGSVAPPIARKMPRRNRPAPSSSSSSEEDLAAFASVAVSFEDVTRVQQEIAQKVIP